MITPPRNILQRIAALSLLAILPVTGYSTIANTPHDLSKQAWAAAGSETCVFCHTPHSGKTGTVPLWNHADTASTFTLYNSTTLNATMGQPTGVSKACLSCHDGTVAMDSFGSTTGTHLMTSAMKLGTDLSNDHPVSFTYDAALATADGSLVSPAGANKVDTGGTIPLFGGKLECASCHDVHNNSQGHFLRKSNSGSALCLSCHNK